VSGARLAGKVAIIAGAGGAMGAAVGAAFVREGARLLLVARRREGLEALAAQLRAAVPVAETGAGAGAGAGAETEAPRAAVEVCAADLTTPAGAQAMVAAAVERFGRLDVLYNNLGDSAFGGVPPHEVSDEAWAYLLKINLEAAFVCSRAVIPVMLAQGGGSIVHVSAAERVRLRANPGYAAAKAGLVELCRRLARAYRDAGIRVNCICPGGIGNDLAAAFDPPPPTLARGAHPADVAGAAVYFGGDESAWVTGQVLEVDGGRGL
jgi:NAD(P)-dependent dehydrogenase (short-subunit alcohol dehydrogenase family)